MLLRHKQITKFESYGNFQQHEYAIESLPGIQLNIPASKQNEEVWLSIERLRETTPPEPESELLKKWIVLTQDYAKPPVLKPGIESEDSDEMVLVEDLLEELEPLLTEYIKKYWTPWSEAEKPRRRSISLYKKLFAISKELSGEILDVQIEMVWGVGIALWRKEGIDIRYPLVTQLVEVDIDDDTMEIRISPGSKPPSFESELFASIMAPGLKTVTEKASAIFSNGEYVFSPFDPETYEEILKAAATQIDSTGRYSPDIPELQAKKILPGQDSRLMVHDSWCIFVRPRGTGIIIDDLRAFKNQAEDLDEAPGAVAAVFKEPSAKPVQVEYPAFRGISEIKGSYGTTTSKPIDLFFPKAFNEEQARIVQLLEKHEGVAAQGPPGTGKTHTIANIVCHYLATGRRVLVTSMKEPALNVLYDMLPEEDIRPLCVSLLNDERGGMKQFENAVTNIANIARETDQKQLKSDVSSSEARLEMLHGRCSDVSRKIDEFAKRNLSKIFLDGEEIHPAEAAKEVVQHIDDVAWLTDAITEDPKYKPQFGNDDIINLRKARANLKKDLEYLGCSLPALNQFPDPRSITRAHGDLSQIAVIDSKIKTGELVPLANTHPVTLEAAQALLDQIQVAFDILGDLVKSRKDWTENVYSYAKAGSDAHLLEPLFNLFAEIEAALESGRVYITKPIATPEGLYENIELTEAINRLKQGKSAFGVSGWFGKEESKKTLKAIKIVNELPATTEDWDYVHSLLIHQKQLCSFVVRWNALAVEFGATCTEDLKPTGIVKARADMQHIFLMHDLAKCEMDIIERVREVIPAMPLQAFVPLTKDGLLEIQGVITSHLQRSRLSEAWGIKERLQQVINGKTGPISDDIRIFIKDLFGNPACSDAAMQDRWTTLMSELARVTGLKDDLDAVAAITGKIINSGGEKWGQALQTVPADGVGEPLLPDNWANVWRWRRLLTYVESLDKRAELQALNAQRKTLEKDLEKEYARLIAGKTRLSIAENAGHAVLSALESYVNAVRHIGKGKGKIRTPRYRQNARDAALHAAPAVPCWICPHYRVSESLPAEFGYFDLVIIDEASQSDMTALPSILRAKKLLIVGDDKQVSPEGIGMDETSIRNLINTYLGNQVELFRPEMDPAHSIYDLFKVVFAGSSIMLKEHFRCVPAIIEYSRREHYQYKLKPLRTPRSSERIDPCLVDVFVRNGSRHYDINMAEARFIVGEIGQIIKDPCMSERTIGVVSLLGEKQAKYIWDMLANEIGLEEIQRHKITCGDSRTFQGKERHIMFLSMVVSRDSMTALSGEKFSQRFNVAASRAKDRMYLVRSFSADELSPADELRKGLLDHFQNPFRQNEVRVASQRDKCDSDFEREMYDLLVERGYRVSTQVKVSNYFIDMVVEGREDRRLAIECDGDIYHGPDKWEEDAMRQRVMERVGWQFWRCFASNFVRYRQNVVDDLLYELDRMNIEPVGADGAPESLHCETREIEVDLERREQGEQQSPQDEGREAGTAEASVSGLDELKRRMVVLLPLEEKVLRMLGIGEKSGKTLEDVAKELQTSTERILEIKEKALRKLRHPVRSTKIIEFIDRDTR